MVESSVFFFFFARDIRVSLHNCNITLLTRCSLVVYPDIRDCNFTLTLRVVWVLYFFC